MRGGVQTRMAPTPQLGSVAQGARFPEDSCLTSVSSWGRRGSPWHPPSWTHGLHGRRVVFR